MRVIDQVNSSLRSFLASSDRTYVMGEDILDPYGGAFKATKGLSSEFPGRVLATPISEAAIVGVATGMALKKKPVCVEIMFGDFLALCSDQLINHMTKLPWVYNDQISIPVVVRAPMGGKRGYGATHSQSLEKHFCGVPGLTVCAISQFSDIASIYADAFAAGTPHLLIENKILYSRQLETRQLAPHEDPDLVIVTYGGSIEASVQAAERLEEDEELAANVIEITQLSPMDHSDVVRRLGHCRKVLVVEEGAPGWGFAAETALALSGVSELRLSTLTGPDHPIPSTKSWEVSLLPRPETIVAAALRLFA